MSRRDPCLNGFGVPKVRYEQLKNARSEADRLGSLNEDDVYSVYRCRNCKHFHVGRQGRVQLRLKLQAYSKFEHELGDRAVAHLLMNDDVRAIKARYKAVERRILGV